MSGAGTEGGHQLMQVKIKAMRLGCVSRDKSNGWKTYILKRNTQRRPRMSGQKHVSEAKGIVNMHYRGS